MSPRFPCVTPGVLELPLSHSSSEVVQSSACGVFVDDLANCSCFYSIRGRCYCGWWLWDFRTLSQFQESEISPGLFQDFIIFVPGVTQGNVDAG